MSETRAKIIGGVGALVVAAIASGVTHYLDNTNWEKQHAVERREYRQEQAQKVFDTVTTRVGRFLGVSLSATVDEQDAAPERKRVLWNEAQKQFRESEIAFPLDRLKVRLYFSDSASRTFDRTLDLMGWSLRETGIYYAGERWQPDSTKALITHLTKVATMMASELESGTEP